MNRILLPVLVLVLVFGGAGYYFLNHQNKILPVPLEQGNVCEPDSMVCADGTVLKREGPACDFPPCPSSTASASAMPESQSVVISGTLICLPHKNTDGPQTLECALGLKGDDGNNYGLNDPGWKYLIGAGNGTKVEITGRLVKKQDQKYDSVGVIEIENLVKRN